VAGDGGVRRSRDEWSSFGRTGVARTHPDGYRKEWPSGRSEVCEDEGGHGGRPIAATPGTRNLFKDEWSQGRAPKVVYRPRHSA